MNLDDVVKEFCRVFKMRQGGKLPPVDLRVSCQQCGHEIIGDETVDFTEKGILCKDCMRGEVVGVTR